MAPPSRPSNAGADPTYKCCSVRQIRTATLETIGTVIRDASKALEAAGHDRNTWYYMLPGSQRGPA